MAIKQSRTNPVIQLDCVVQSVERDLSRVYKDDQPTGEVTDKGRKLLVVTAMDSPLLELKVPVTLDPVVFEVGQHLLVNAEYMEWSLDSGRNGSTMRFHSFVSASQLDAWPGIVKSQARTAQPA